MSARISRFASYLLILFVCLTISLAVSDAQNSPQIIAGRNINMVSGTKLPWGDPYLQRQNEPSGDASTRNPMHLLAGANDYRIVDLVGTSDDNHTRDAWLGVFKSFDGGQSWQSMLMPGWPGDSSVEGSASPLKGRQAAADPTVRAGHNGLFYYSGISFDRNANGVGNVFVARFMDLNNAEGVYFPKMSGYTPATGASPGPEDPIKYIDTKVIDSGTAGQFIDKPWLATDVPIQTAGLSNLPPIKDANAASGVTKQENFPCGNVYIAYAIFTGDTSKNVRSKVMFARSTNCGGTWGNPIMIDQSYRIGQGATIAIDPAQPGTVYVAWRYSSTTSEANAIMVAKSTDGGQRFSKAVEVVAFGSGSPTSFFEQGSLPTDAPYDVYRAFRAPAFPTMAVGNGRVYIAWSQKGADNIGRIVISTSTDGVTWSSSPALAEDPPANAHQLMPSLTFSYGKSNSSPQPKLTLLYYDFRDDLLKGNEPIPGMIVDVISSEPNRHTIDVRAAQANPGSAPTFSSIKVSQYFSVITDVDKTNPLWIPVWLQLQHNPPNYPMFAGGLRPFIGDFVDIAAASRMVYRNGGWQFNTGPVDLHSFWTDNRDVIPPPGPLYYEWESYVAPGKSGCGQDKAGMRNQNIYTSRLTEGMVVGTMGNSKDLSSSTYRTFVVWAQNMTNESKLYHLTAVPIANSSANPSTTATFSETDSALTTLDVPSILPRQGFARTVFVESFVPRSSVEVTVTEYTMQAGKVSHIYPAGSTSVAVDWVMTQTSPKQGDSLYLDDSQKYTVDAVGETTLTISPGLARDVAQGQLCFLLPSNAVAGLTRSVVLNPDPLNPPLLIETERHTPIIRELPEFTFTWAPPFIWGSNNNVVVNPALFPDPLSPPPPSYLRPEALNPSMIAPSMIAPSMIAPSMIAPSMIAPSMIAPSMIAPSMIAPSMIAPSMIAPSMIAPSMIATPITDVTWTVENAGNVDSGFKFAPFGKLPDGAKTQLFIYRTYKTFRPGQNCGSATPAYEEEGNNIEILTNMIDPSMIAPSMIASSISDAVTDAITFKAGRNEKIYVKLRIWKPGDPTPIDRNSLTLGAAVAAEAGEAGGSAATAATLSITTSSSSLAPGKVGVHYNASLESVGGNGTSRTWSVSAGLPPDLRLTSSGQISGIPTQAGTFSFTVTVKDESVPTPQSSSANLAILINKGDATCSVSGYTGVYDGAAHGASGSCTGVGGPSDVLSGLNLGATFKDVPGGVAHWVFTGNGNYRDQSGDVAIVINKADATCSVSGYSGVYDAASHGASGSCSGKNGESAGTLDLGATYKNVSGGTASWTFTGNGNYKDQSGDVAITITQRAITVTADNKSKTYGDADPPLTYNVTNGSLVGTDGFTGALTRAPGESVGTYAIQQGTLALSGNYTLAYIGANLTINSYTFIGFLPPLGPADTSTVYGPFGLRTAIPVKWQLKNVQGAFINDLNTKAKLTAAVNTDCKPPAEGNPEILFTGGTVFRYDTGTNQYIFNWDTTGLARGCYNLVLSLNDGTSRTVIVQLK